MTQVKALLIDGVTCPISKIEPSTHGYTAVYVNRNASCHSVPTNWLTNRDNHLSVKTSGHIYTKVY